MKKSLMMLLTAILMCTVLVGVLPKETTYAKSTFEMNYDELINYWSVQPYYYQVYYAEVNNSSYIYDIKMDSRKYFVASLTDYCICPNELAQTRPLTYKFMADVMAVSDPAIYNGIRNGNISYSLPELLLEEMNRQAPYLSAQDRNNNIPILVSYLNSQGVYNVNQYNEWKKMNGGKTAYEVYIHHLKDPSDAWLAQANAAAEAQAKLQQQINETAAANQAQLEADIAAATQAQQDYQNNLVEQAMAIQQQQMDLINNFWN